MPTDTPSLALWLALYALATTRITGLITQDTITAALRDRATLAAERHRATRPLAELIQCPWCTAVWVAAAITVAAALWHGHPALAWTVLGLALAQVAGMLSSIGRAAE